ncbi:MAG: hypothetical protein ACKVU1_04870 [bacterium]
MVDDDKVDDEIRDDHFARASEAARDLMFLRATSPAYKALLRAAQVMFDKDGTDVRVQGFSGPQPDPVLGLAPCMTVKTDKRLILIEVATNAMMKNAHLAERLNRLAKAKGAEKWLVVAFDDLMDAEELVRKVETGWRPIVAGG